MIFRGKKPGRDAVSAWCSAGSAYVVLKSSKVFIKELVNAAIGGGY